MRSSCSKLLLATPPQAQWMNWWSRLLTDAKNSVFLEWSVLPTDAWNIRCVDVCSVSRCFAFWLAAHCTAGGIFFKCQKFAKVSPFCPTEQRNSVCRAWSAWPSALLENNCWFTFRDMCRFAAYCPAIPCAQRPAAMQRGVLLRIAIEQAHRLLDQPSPGVRVIKKKKGEARALEASQGQHDSFFRQLSYKCYLEEEVSVGNWLKICPWVASKVDKCWVGTAARGRWHPQVSRY